jgi:hypothetical protein
MEGNGVEVAAGLGSGGETGLTDRKEEELGVSELVDDTEGVVGVTTEGLGEGIVVGDEEEES